jgi:hypothetical protein
VSDLESKTRAELVRGGWAKDYEEAQAFIDAKTMVAAQVQLRVAFREAFRPTLVWIDGQLRRVPRFYAWLSK